MIWWRTIPCNSAALHLNSTSQLSSSADRCLRGAAYTAHEIRALPGLRGVDVSRIIAGRPYQVIKDQISANLHEMSNKAVCVSNNDTVTPP